MKDTKKNITSLKELSSMIKADSPTIRYKKKKVWKYPLDKETVIQVEINHLLTVRQREVLPFIHFKACDDGTLKITFKKGYCWDGPSGPVLDYKKWMRASLYHDGLYQGIRNSIIPNTERKQADKIFKEVLIEDGVKPYKARLAYMALRKFGAKATRSKVIIAP